MRPSSRNAAAATEDDNETDDDASLGYRQRRQEDDLLYVILGVTVGAILIGLLVALFVCARRQHRQRLLLGMSVRGCELLFSGWARVCVVF